MLASVSSQSCRVRGIAVLEPVPRPSTEDGIPLRGAWPAAVVRQERRTAKDGRHRRGSGPGADVHEWIDADCKSKGVLVRGSASPLVENKTGTRTASRSPAPTRSPPWSEVLKLILPGEDLSQHERLTDLDVDWWESTLRHDDRKRAQYALTVARRTGFPALRSTPRLVVGTIHSVKGGEADVVYLLPDLSGVGYFEGWRRGGDTRNAIIRQFYVGMTRAREELVLCSPSGSESVRWL
jgi:hypothetical protein